MSLVHFQSSFDDCPVPSFKLKGYSIEPDHSETGNTYLYGDNLGDGCAPSLECYWIDLGGEA